EMPRLAAISDLFSQPRCFVGVDLAMDKQQPRPEKSSYVVRGRGPNYPQRGWVSGVPFRFARMRTILVNHYRRRVARACAMAFSNSIGSSSLAIRSPAAWKSKRRA